LALWKDLVLQEKVDELVNTVGLMNRFKAGMDRFLLFEGLLSMYFNYLVIFLRLTTFLVSVFAVTVSLVYF